MTKTVQCSPFEPSETSERKCSISEMSTEHLVFEEVFAEVRLNDEWLKVEVVGRHGSTDENYLVQRIDGFGLPFKVKASQLSSFGSNDPKTEHEIYNLTSLRNS